MLKRARTHEQCAPVSLRCPRWGSHKELYVKIGNDAFASRYASLDDHRDSDPGISVAVRSVEVNVRLGLWWVRIELDTVIIYDSQRKMD